MNQRASGPTGFLVPCRVLACLSVLLLANSGSQAATPPSGNVSTASPNSTWDFAPVVAGQFTNVGIQDTCPPGVCDNYDLTVSLPQPADTFYQTMTATLTLHYEWTSSAPTDMDMFAISPTGAEYGPGNPDGTVTGPGFSDIVITDPVDGVWHVRETAALVPIPTASHATASLTAATRTSPSAPKIPPGAPKYANYPADESMAFPVGSTT